MHFPPSSVKTPSTLQVQVSACVHLTCPMQSSLQADGLQLFIITLRSPVLWSKGFHSNSPGAHCAGPLIKEFASSQKKWLLQIQLSWRKISALLLQNYSWEQQLSQSPSDTLHLWKTWQSTSGKWEFIPQSDKVVDLIISDLLSKTHVPTSAVKIPHFLFLKTLFHLPTQPEPGWSCLCLLGLPKKELIGWSGCCCTLSQSQAAGSSTADPVQFSGKEDIGKPGVWAGKLNCLEKSTQVKAESSEQQPRKLSTF